MLNFYRRHALLLMAIAGLLWQSCLVHYTDPIPTYVHIDSFQYIKNPLWSALPSTHAITNVSIYYNNNPIGTFDLPCTVPIITNDTGTLELEPAVVVDGLNNDISTYPFYTFYNIELKPNPGKIDTIRPTTEFVNDLNQTTLAFFEGTIDFTAVEASQVQFSPTPASKGGDSLTQNGYWTGVLRFTVVGDSSVDSNNKSFSLTTGQPAFIEFDYKCNIPFYVGLSAYLTTGISSTPYFLSGIYPSNTWRKFYLSITDFNAQYQGDAYSFYIKATMPADSTYGLVLIENVQLLTFN